MRPPASLHTRTDRSRYRSSLLREGALASVVLDDAGRLAGFGLLKPFLPFPAFKKTGMFTYFIAPEDTGRGLGTRLLGWLTDNAWNAGIKVLVANISSKNKASIRVHKHMGSVRPGTLPASGKNSVNRLMCSGCRGRWSEHGVRRGNRTFLKTPVTYGIIIVPGAIISALCR